MNTMELVHFVSTGERPRQRSLPAAVPHDSELVRRARGAMIRARQFLLSEQRSDGSWLSPRASDASLASQMIFLLAYRGDDETPFADQAAAAILAQQLPEGGWPRLPGGPADLSISVQAYLALKLTGLAPNDERLARARVVIRRLGGADAADAVTRYFLALFGQIDYDFCPPARSELSLQRSAPATLSASLALIWSHRPVRDVGVERGVRELFIARPAEWPVLTFDLSACASRTARARPWLTFLDSVVLGLLAQCERIGWMPLRHRVIERAESVLLQNIQPSQIGRLSCGDLVWHAIALRAIGYSSDRGELRRCEDRLNELVRDEDDFARLQPSLRSEAESDTLAALQSLRASGLSPEHPCVEGGVQWLRQVGRRDRPLSPIDLAVALRAIGCDDGNKSPDELLPAIQVFRRSAIGRPPHGGRDSARWHRYAGPLVRRLVKRQNPDGGWGVASGRPSSPDITGVVLEALARNKGTNSLPARVRNREKGPHDLLRAIDQAVTYLRREQRADGSWDSTTGVRFVHGTSLAVRGLVVAGATHADEVVAAGLNWLVAHQHVSSGWGESVHDTKVDSADEFVAGPATASQTAWALVALIDAGRWDNQAVRQGVQFLLETQDEDGRWRELPFVQHDAQDGHWFRSELLSTVDASLALSRWVTAAVLNGALQNECAPLRLVGAS
jgi:squalene-hopene/tetraprenyl-beta-curcumene cyclase